MHDLLSVRDTKYWQIQALILAYQGTPWKFVAPLSDQVARHKDFIRHTLEAVGVDMLQNVLSVDIATDLACTLLEAVRFPDMKWKNFALSTAQTLAMAHSTPYLLCRLAEMYSLVARLNGSVNKAVQKLDHPIIESEDGYDNRDRRVNAARGLIAVQHAVNAAYNGNVSSAASAFQNWVPLDAEPSPIESTVIFYKHLVFGRALRMAGQFEPALEHLELANTISSRSRGDAEPIFDEEQRMLLREWVDTQRDKDGGSAVVVSTWRSQLEVVGPSLLEKMKRSAGSENYLDVSLAECLFAVSALPAGVKLAELHDAEKQCRTILSRRNLTRMEKLRAHITLAKALQVNKSDVEALDNWAKAQEILKKSPYTCRFTNSIILRSMLTIWQRNNQNDQAHQAEAKLRELHRVQDEHFTMKYWIPGLAAWEDYVFADTNWM